MRRPISPALKQVFDIAARQGAVAGLAEHLREVAHDYLRTQCIGTAWKYIASLPEGAHTQFLDALKQMCRVVEACRQFLTSTAVYFLAQGAPPGSADHVVLSSLDQKFNLTVAASLYSAAPPKITGMSGAVWVGLLRL